MANTLRHRSKNMDKVISFFRIITISVLLHELCLQTTVTACSCDVSQGCDNDCCCDANCTYQEVLSFPCFPSSNRSELVACIQPIFKWNLNFPYVGLLEDGQFCVRKFIEAPDVQKNSTSSSASNFSDAFSLYNFTSHFKIDSFFSKSGDPVYVLNLKTNLVERFSLPQMRESISASPIAYLHDVNSTSFYPMDDSFLDALSNCSFDNHQLLSPSNYINHKFIKNQIFLKQSNESGDVTVAFNLTQALIEAQCTITNRNFSDCNITSSLIDGQCSNLVSKAEYVVRYGQDGIKMVSIQLSLADANETSRPLSQQFVVIFRQPNESLFPSVNSGHPGYLIGHPLITSDAAGEICQPFNGTELTLLSSSSDRGCSADAPGMGVDFGRNALTGCLYEYRIDSDSACQDSSRRAREMLLRYKPGFVASSGDAKTGPCKSVNWIPIVYSDDVSGSDRCTDAVVGLNLRVFYSNVGIISKPLHFVIGMRVEFVKRNLNDYILCGYSDCKAPTSIFVNLASSLNFIDLSRSPRI